ncbi:hypothetical protein LCGC14_1055570 [marine sediment metagenome]|uniref:Uncharacterized protein n=1 Tax=marine sediment metagenome TaxID=412755 RepID=A0A0F9N9I2_9ZZZZ
MPPGDNSITAVVSPFMYSPNSIPLVENISGTMTGNIKNNIMIVTNTNSITNPSFFILIVDRFFPNEYTVVNKITIKNKKNIGPPLSIGTSETDEITQLTSCIAKKLINTI